MKFLSPFSPHFQHLDLQVVSYFEVMHAPTQAVKDGKPKRLSCLTWPYAKGEESPLCFLTVTRDCTIINHNMFSFQSSKLNALPLLYMWVSTFITAKYRQLWSQGCSIGMEGTCTQQWCSKSKRWLRWTMYINW